MLKSVLIDYNPVFHIFDKLTNKLGIVGDLSSYLRELIFDKDDKVLEKMLFLIGMTAITLKTAKTLSNTICKWNWIPKYIIGSKQLS